MELNLWMQGGGEEVVRVRPDSVDLSAHTGLVTLPSELRACAGRVRSLAASGSRNAASLTTKEAEKNVLTNVSFSPVAQNTHGFHLCGQSLRPSLAPNHFW